MGDRGALAALQGVSQGGGKVPPGAAVPGGAEAMDLSVSLNEQEMAAREARLAEEGRRRRLPVPTRDDLVRRCLRDLKEPITLFGERELERRTRLVDLVAEGAFPETMRILEETGGVIPGEGDGMNGGGGGGGGGAPGSDVVMGQAQTEAFYTPGHEGLPRARVWLTYWSLSTAATRGEEDARQAAAWSWDSVETARMAYYTHLGSMTVNASQLAATRPLAGLGVDASGSTAATVDWSGALKFWDVDTLSCIGVNKTAHSERATALAWRPGATYTGSRLAIDARTGMPANGSGANVDPAAKDVKSGPGGLAAIATAGADNNVNLWSTTGAPLLQLRGHAHRVTNLSWHPSGTLLGSASYDRSWRMWDIGNGGSIDPIWSSPDNRELLLQEGHSRAVYSIAMHPDGSLVASGGLDGVIWLWDMRSGKGIVSLTGHAGGVLSLDWSPSGSSLASGSADHTIRVWDLRVSRGENPAVMAGHTKFVTNVQWAPTAAGGAGHAGSSALVSSSFDGTVRLWAADSFVPIRTLAGHGSLVTRACFAGLDGKRILSVSHDRTLKHWGL